MIIIWKQIQVLKLSRDLEKFHLPEFSWQLLRCGWTEAEPMAFGSQRLGQKNGTKELVRRNGKRHAASCSSAHFDDVRTRRKLFLCESHFERYKKSLRLSAKDSGPPSLAVPFADATPGVAMASGGCGAKLFSSFAGLSSHQVKSKNMNLLAFNALAVIVCLELKHT